MSQTDFDAVAAAYDESLPPHVVEHYLRKRTRFIVDHCPRGSGLDVGCGTGMLAARLVECGYRMAGVDPSAGMLDVLRHRSPGIEAVQGSGTALPFEDDSFDLVVTVAVMHHIAEPVPVRRTLAEMMRVAKPSGRVLVWDHNPRNPYWKRLMARVPQDTGEERLIPEAEIVGGIEAAGGEILLSQPLGLVPDFVPPVALGAAAVIERAVERIPLVRDVCAHNVILARPGGQTPARAA